MAESPTNGQSGGVNIHGGTVNTGGGEIVGRDKVVQQATSHELEEALRPLADVISVAPAEIRSEAQGKLEKLKKEAAKPEKHDDGAVAKLIEGLVGLVPDAARAVVGAFGTPILAAFAGPVTKYVLGNLKGE